jgi:hypothetical protein
VNPGTRNPKIPISRNPDKLLLLALCLLQFSAVSGQPGWNLRRERKGVVIHTRTPAGSTLKEYRVNADIESPLTDVYSFLTDLERRPEWVVNCMGLEILDTLNGEIRYHTRFDIPWPVADRDLLVSVTSSLDEKAGRAHLLSVHAGMDHPLEDGVVRMTRYREEVFLERIAAGRTSYRVEGFADPGGEMPAWIVNMFLVDGIYDSVIRTRQAVMEQSEKKVRDNQ